MIEVISFATEPIKDVAVNPERFRIAESLKINLAEMIDSIENESSFDASALDLSEEINKGEVAENSFQMEAKRELDPRSTFIKNGHSFETDDNGVIYKKDGELIPGVEYSSNGWEYRIKDDGKVEIIKEGYATTYRERLDQTPINNGYWTGKRGESKFIPFQTDVNTEANEELAKYGINGIEYNNAVPDFSVCCEETVELDEMTDVRAVNFMKADSLLAEKWNKLLKDGKDNWTAEDVKKYRAQKRLTIHECPDRITCQYVPTDIHQLFGHSGGVCECKKISSLNNEVKFDD